MRNLFNFLIIAYCLLQLSCGRQREVTNSFGFKPPKIVEAKLYKIPPDKTVPPIKILATGARKVIAGKPETVNIPSNVFPAKTSRIITAGTPKLIIPNGESFQLPKVVPATDSPIIASQPEIILLKEPFIKEHNPESFSSIKATHGLNSNEISSLCQDKAGNLWIGAWWGGVSRYDGRWLTNYSVAQGLSSDVVNCMAEDNNGNMWIGTTRSGVDKFDGRYITHYSIKEGLSDSSIKHMLQDKNGDMWIATENGLNRYDGHSFTHYTIDQGLPTNIVLCLMEDSKGNLWVGNKGGLTRFDGQSFQNYTSVLGLKDGTDVRDLAEDSQGNLWFATGNELCKYDGQYTTYYTTEEGFSANITRIMKDRRGDIWIGTRNQGAYRFDGKSFIHYGAIQGLGNESVTDVLEDRHGNIWLATTSGVSKYDGKLFSHIIPLKQEEVESLLADKRGNIWIGTGAGNCLNKYDGRSLSRYTTAQGLTSTAINFIFEDRNGNIWFGSRAGVNRYDGKYFTNFGTQNGLINNDVFCIMEDKAGNLWIGTEKGLSKFDGKYFTNYSIAQGLKGQTIYSLLEDHNGIIWIGTSDKGVFSFDGNTFTHYDITQSLSHPMVLGIMEDKNNNIWFCTSLGVNKYDGKYFTWYTNEQGLSNNIAKNVLEDRNGNIWIGTINGINMLRPSPSTTDTMHPMLVSLFKKYTVSEGFLGGGTYENTLSQDSKGNIWIGATDRVALYHPEGDIPDSIPPTIRLSGIALYNENINWLDAERNKDSIIILNNGSKLRNFQFSGLTPWYNLPENLQLNFDNNYLAFQFIGITTCRPKEIRYQYFLEGLDKHWSIITDQTVATYNNLPHGNYTFKVKAVNSEGHWSKELNYSFAIMPPWWRTWWAYVSYAIIFGVMIWMFTWYRSRQLKTENIRLEDNVNKRTMELEQSLEERYQLIKKVESQEALLKERLRISRELHDDIGSTLGSISIYSEVARKRTAKKENTNEVLSKIGHASRELIDKMSDIVWSLNPNNESFEQLQHHMMAFAAMILAPQNIQFDFIVDEELKSIQFTGEQRKNIFLIFKEALHNIAKYADCKNVFVHLSVNDNNMAMEIKDDGKGFDASEVTKISLLTEVESLGGNGIKNMQARANDMNAGFNIHSKINEGTAVQLTLPL